MYRIALIANLLGYASAAWANSCSNVDVIGTFDDSGITENEYGIYAAGTFRVEREADESKQPNFNLTRVNCEKQRDDTGRVSLECKLTQAALLDRSEKPNIDTPNCSLDLSSSTYPMKELQKGVLAGMEPSIAVCFNSILTIDKNTNRVYLSFMRTKDADGIEKTHPGMCKQPRKEVLMNCTAYPRLRKNGQAPPRYCDFSSSSDKRQ
jgi:hypothetical protein